jgi:hypothetical protein
MPPGAIGAAARRTPSESRIASGQGNHFRSRALARRDLRFLHALRETLGRRRGQVLAETCRATVQPLAKFGGDPCNRFHVAARLRAACPTQLGRHLLRYRSSGAGGLFCPVDPLSRRASSTRLCGGQQRPDHDVPVRHRSSGLVCSADPTCCTGSVPARTRPYRYPETQRPSGGDTLPRGSRAVRATGGESPGND